jgi:hypothetical protein
MSGCEKNLVVHYTDKTNDSWNKKKNDWMDKTLPQVFKNTKDQGYVPNESLAKVSREDIKIAATMMATAKCSNTDLAIDEAVKAKNGNKGDNVAFWSHSHHNYTVMGEQSCTFLV